MGVFGILTVALIAITGLSLAVTLEGNKFTGLFKTSKGFANKVQGRAGTTGEASRNLVKTSEPLGLHDTPKPHEYPFLVSIENYDEYVRRHVCTGSIISTTTVLTSQYCSSLCSSYRCRIVVGAQDPWEADPYPISYAIKCGEGHPKFDGSYLNFDYGVLYTNDPIKLESGKIEILELPKTSSVIPTTNCVSPGWGLEANGKLEHVNVTIYTRETCEKYYYNFQDRMICGYDPQKPYQLLDFGGPLLCNGTLAGIGSWAHPPSGSPEHPAVFTDVSTELAWIKSKINGTCT